MAKEDILLREEMGRLEIAPIKINKSKTNENPFLSNSKRGQMKKPSVPNKICSCTSQKKNTNIGICKRKNNKILKEPVLQILKKSVGHNTVEQCSQEPSIFSSQNVNIDNLCILVKNCNELKISGANEQIKSKDPNDKTKWWKNDVVCSKENLELKHQSNQTGSCSQQALNPPCDITIDELASYFETLVHIPKKMSSMAEMMYI